VQKGLSAPQNVRAFLPVTDMITKDFVDGLTSGPIADFLPDISRLNLEREFDFRIWLMVKSRQSLVWNSTFLKFDRLFEIMCYAEIVCPSVIFQPVLRLVGWNFEQSSCSRNPGIWPRLGRFLILIQKLQIYEDLRQWLTHSSGENQLGT
jgi:hypothetical protein